MRQSNYPNYHCLLVPCGLIAAAVSDVSIEAVAVCQFGLVSGCGVWGGLGLAGWAVLGY